MVGMAVRDYDIIELFYPLRSNHFHDIRLPRAGVDEAGISSRFHEHRTPLSDVDHERLDHRSLYHRVNAEHYHCDHGQSCGKPRRPALFQAAGCFFYDLKSSSSKRRERQYHCSVYYQYQPYRRSSRADAAYRLRQSAPCGGNDRNEPAHEFHHVFKQPFQRP